MKKPLVLMILDGWGLAKDCSTNAATRANTPNLTKLIEEYPHTELICSGEAVGLPPGQMGNSEVGHMNIGAGRIVYQELTHISKTIKDKSFFMNENLVDVMEQTASKGTALHIMGLLSDGGVHSHIEHLKAIVDLASQKKLKRVFIHIFLDGRDVPPKSALGYLKDLEESLCTHKAGEVATVSGRYFAMDRDQRWERLQKTYEVMTKHYGPCFSSAQAGIEEAYKNGITDEFVVPFWIKTKEDSRLGKEDSVIFFNFRPDRARQITRAFLDEKLDVFPREFILSPEAFVCMTQYDETIKTKVAFPPKILKNTFGAVVAEAGLKQLRIAETEKYAHVTFFFNGGAERPNHGEERILVPSPKVATYDLEPEMSAYRVTNKLLEALDNDCYDVVILNFANPDMVGHTGSFEAAVRALETVDQCVGRICQKVLSLQGELCITADHGNLEEMEDLTTHEPCTSHTTNKVPFILVSNRKYQLKEGILADIAPTMLELLNIEQPVEMTGQSLIKK
ncbi:MAG TPA: 2,3-bisphosphoglycerate-independent phosphoglycerate mutase [Candidatus Avacidaminococcus intestinavium]|uniref:2,3-bisphosphoglycerate-independent phosphoglycerate mutase n=1 Tax=Candidatus Avacidaminococcus intestinavium TaxID=2840684 RepID=A0A9D1MP58_9FIRM|nr:2,3-bisphosphoglycerate-independent phosphoglycerate mutase [Candidatus Avacidaminococcus intestinavium]